MPLPLRSQLDQRTLSSRACPSEHLDGASTACRHRVDRPMLSIDLDQGCSSRMAIVCLINKGAWNDTDHHQADVFGGRCSRRCNPVSPGWSPSGGPSLSVDSAQARVGRPLTPVSVAGVARRSTRRAVVGGAGRALLRPMRAGGCVRVLVNGVLRLPLTQNKDLARDDNSSLRSR